MIGPTARAAARIFPGQVPPCLLGVLLGVGLAYEASSSVELVRAPLVACSGLVPEVALPRAGAAVAMPARLVARRAAASVADRLEEAAARLGRVALPGPP